MQLEGAQLIDTNENDSQERRVLCVQVLCDIEQEASANVRAVDIENAPKDDAPNDVFCNCSKQVMPFRGNKHLAPFLSEVAYARYARCRTTHCISQRRARPVSNEGQYFDMIVEGDN